MGRGSWIGSSVGGSVWRYEGVSCGDMKGLRPQVLRFAFLPRPSIGFGCSKVIPFSDYNPTLRQICSDIPFTQRFIPIIALVFIATGMLEFWMFAYTLY